MILGYIEISKAKYLFKKINRYLGMLDLGGPSPCKA